MVNRQSTTQMYLNLFRQIPGEDSILRDRNKLHIEPSRNNSLRLEYTETPAGKTIV